MKKELTFLFLIMIFSISSISALGDNFIFSSSRGNINLSTVLLSGTKLNCSDIIGGDDANFCSDATGAGGTDTNASTACSGGEYLAGNGSCLNVSVADTTLSQEEVEDYVGGMTNGSLDYDDTNGILFINYTWFSNLFDTLFGNKDTDDLSEGSTNLYDNQSWNESLADSKYATIGAGADNESWNESYASELFQEDIGADCSVGDFVKGVDDDGTLDCSTPSYTTDTNETTRVNTIVGTDCGAGNYSYGFDDDGNIQCRADTTGGAGGNPFDQELNTTEEPTFEGLSLVDITENTPIELNFNFSNGDDIILRYTSDGTFGFIGAGGYVFDNNISGTGDINASGVVCDGSGNCLNTVDTDTNTNCSSDGSCDGITYDSETTNWDKDKSDDFTNLTNFTGTLTDTKICRYDETNHEIDCDYTDQTGASGNPKQGDGIYLYNDTDTIYLNETKLNLTIDDRDDDTNTNCSVDNSCPDIAYDSEIDVNKTYVDAQDSAQDECSEITGCVENAITNATMNKTVDCSDIVGGSDGDYCADATGTGDAGYYNSSRINTTQFEDTGGTLHLLDSWINTLIDNRVTQAFVEALGFYTDTEIDSFGYYNSSDFDINDYYNSTETDTEITNANTSMKNYVDNEIAGVEGNSSWNESYADTLYISQSDEPNLNVNSSGYWDNLDSPSDINAGDITDDGTYLTSYTETDPAWTGNETNVAFKNEENTFTANQNLNNYNVTSVQCITFNNGASWCGV